MVSPAETHDRNLELHRSVTLELSYGAITEAALLTNLMWYKNLNEGFEELIKTGWRFHNQFPYEPEFLVVHSNGQIENSRDLLKTMNQPGSRQDVTPFNLQIPEKIAREIDVFVYHHEVTMQEATMTFLEEGMIIQRTLQAGGKIQLLNGSDTWYNFVSLKEEFHLRLNRFIHLK